MYILCIIVVVLKKTQLYLSDSFISRYTQRDKYTFETIY